MLSPADAARRIVDNRGPLEVEELPIAAARDRVLAEDVASTITIPPWDNSAMDGFALKSDSLQGQTPGELVLRVAGEIPAGGFPGHLPEIGECVRIFTGAPIPKNCDTVIRQEDVSDLAGCEIRVNDFRDSGRNVRKAGEDIAAGSIILNRGDPLGPAQIGLLASIARATVPVYRTPTVAFMGSGDEIVDLDRADEIIAGRKIASSNSYTLNAMIQQAGAVPLNLGIARDDPADLKERLSKAADADIVVTSAGISVGEHDYIRTVLDELGATQDFWRIQMRPGAPVGFGSIDEKPWVGLPGNPVSTMVTFELFVRPLIRVLQGHSRPFRRTVPVVVRDPVKLGAKLTHFLRVIVRGGQDGLDAYLTGPQGSGILSSMAKADGLLIVPAETPSVEPGTGMRAILLNDPVHVAEPGY